MELLLVSIQMNLSNDKLMNGMSHAADSESLE